VLQIFSKVPFSLKILFVYLRERESESTGVELEGEADSLLSGEADAGLDPRTPRSRPGPKSDAQPT